MSVAVLLLQGGLAVANDARIDRFVVKWRGDSPAATSFLLSPRQAAAGAALRDTGETTRDGARYYALTPPLSLDAARAALNKLRLDATVLYANFARNAEVAPASGRAKAGTESSPPTDRIIVRYKSPSGAGPLRTITTPSQADVDRIAALAGASLSFVRAMHDGAHVLQMLQRLPVAQVEAIAARIAMAPDVDFAQPDYIDQIAAIPNDPCYASAGASCGGDFQWDLFEAAGGVNIPPAWNVTTGVSNLFIAVVDTGALFDHPDLAGRFIGGYDMINALGAVNPNDGDNRDADPSDPGDWNTAGQCGAGSVASNSSWHGSHVAGTIGAIANNGTGVAGINWVSRIVPVRALGRCGGFSSDISDGMAWASGAAVSGVPANPNPARVLNVSIGGTRPSQTCDAVYQSAINTVLANGAVIAVSAGNGNQSASFNTPGNCNGVITVAATGRTGGRASYSNFGTLVEIAAPGGDFALSAPNDLGILSTISSGPTTPGEFVYGEYYGTSMASPHVAGIASLMLSVRPLLTPSQVQSIIQSTARKFPTGTGTDCTTSICGAGIIDAAAAVKAAAGTTSTTTLGTSANPAGAGSSVTFTATVSATAPTGSVRFVDGYSVIAGCNAIALAGSGNARTAACTTASLSPGVHTIAAEYSGDAVNGASRSAAVNQAVNAGPVASTTALSTSANPAVLGTTLTFTAAVSGNNPTGTVAFADGGATIGGCGTVALGGTGNTRQATCNTTSLSLGTHSIVAVYGGDAANLGSSSAPLSQTINPVATTTSLTSSANPAPVGVSIMFTATITGLAPSGTVAFFDGAASLAGCAAVPLGGAGNSRTAQCAAGTLRAGTHTITAVYGGDGTNATSTSAALMETLTVVASVRKSRDFDGNGITDLLWRDGNGTTVMWLMNGTSATGTSTLRADPDWVPTATAFVDADNDADILWRNAATGETSLWHMNGGVVASTTSIFTSNVWSVTNVADFTGDGKADLLWYNSATGETGMWVMNGDTGAAKQVLNAPPPWRVTHIADFNGDGASDLIWRNGATGQTAMWLINGLSYLSGAILQTPADWRVTHTGDFNGDGKADLVWRNDSTGETAIWLMSGTTYLGGARTPTMIGWQVTHVGDFDGDGKTDLAWRNLQTGEIAIWLMNGIVNTGNAILAVGPNASVVAVGDYDGDGKSDLVFRNAVSGEHTLWLMNGVAPAGTAALPIGTAFTVVP